MIWRIFIVLSLVIVAALSLFSRRDRPDELPRLRRLAPPQPGYFMTDAQVLQTGPDGTPLYRVNADRIRQDPSARMIHLEDLRLEYRTRAQEGEGRTWTLTAREGLIPETDERTPGPIQLQGEVEVIGQPPDESTPPATIRTEQLLVDLKSEIVHTQEEVQMVWGDRTLNARGLTADLKAERVQLESAVHGRINQ